MTILSAETSPLRICMLVETFAPEVGGGETQARMLAEGFVERGCDVRVLTRRSARALPRAEQLGRIRITRLAPAGRGQLKKWGLGLTVFLDLVRRRSEYDALLACPFRILGVPAVLASRWLRKPCILKAETNGEFSGAFFGPGLARWRLSPDDWVVRQAVTTRNRLLRRASAFVALSSTIATELRAHGIDPAAIHQIPNGVDTELFRPVWPEERAARRRAIGIAPEQPLFVFTGRLVSYKGLPLLVEVWRRIHETHPSARLLLVGSGGADIHNCEDALRHYVAEHGLDRAVTFVGEVADVVPYLQAADAFVFPTEKEAFGVALVEAMACGLPVVTTLTGGIADIVTDGVDALVVDAGNREQLQAALERLLTDRALAFRLGDAARATATRRFGHHEVVSRYLDLVRSLVFPPPVARPS